MASFTRYSSQANNLRIKLVSLSKKRKIPVDELLKIVLSLLFIRGLNFGYINNDASKAARSRWSFDENKIRDVFNSYISLINPGNSNSELQKKFPEFNFQLASLFEPHTQDSLAYTRKVNGALIWDLINLSTFAENASRDFDEYEYTRTVFDHLFYTLLGKPLRSDEQFYARLIQGLHQHDDMIYSEYPLLTGELVVNNEEALTPYANYLLTHDSQHISLFLTMRLALHKINATNTGEASFYLCRDGKSSFFDADDISALHYFSKKRQKNPYTAMIEISGNINKKDFDHIINSGRLFSVIESSGQGGSKLRKIFLISDKQYFNEILFIDISLISSALDLTRMEEAELIGCTLSSCFKIPWQKSKIRNEMNYQAQAITSRLFSQYENLAGYCQRVPREKITQLKHLRTTEWIAEPTQKNTFNGLSSNEIYDEIVSKNRNKCHYIIGNNGVGKSYLLQDIAKKAQNENPEKTVLMLSFGFSDRFHTINIVDKKKLIYLGDRPNSKVITFNNRQNMLGKLIIIIFQNEKKRNLLSELLDKFNLTSEVYFLPPGYEIIDNELYSNEETYNINLLQSDNIIDSKKLKNYLLAFQKVGIRSVIPFTALSSGEQHILIMLVRIVSSIESGCIVLIDEPELSLHVKWQQLLPWIFTKISQEFDVSLVIATHSPILITAVDHKHGQCYQASSERIIPISEEEVKNMEATLLDAFDIVTKNNRSVYEHCATAIANFMQAVNQSEAEEIEYARNKALTTLSILRNKIKNNLVKIHNQQSDIQLLKQAEEAIKEIYTNHYNESNYAE
ncbi:putative ATPase [Pantoea alhagi]|uniref:AAA family ATPase n=1 Tax=Mixta sp. BE291 TaxID=3158787 RepID=UPI00285E1C1E|nr:putative ATPase [Pantoea alhagi]